MQIQQTILNLTNNNPDFVHSIIILCLTTLIYIIKKAFFRSVIKKIVDKTPTKLDNELYPLVNRLISIIIWLAGGFYILTELGINIRALIATIGASSILIAWACKDTLSNIIAGIVIMADRPFRIDDNIILPSGENVYVLSIGLRRSRFFHNPDESEFTASVIIVPNVNLVKNKIKNYTYASELIERGE